MTPSQFWVIESTSVEEFKDVMDKSKLDIPFDSNVMVYFGNKSESLDIYDVYRPHPKAEIR